MSEELTTSPNLRGYYAGFVSRLIAFSLDLLLVVAGQIIVVVMINIVFNFLGLNALVEALTGWEPDSGVDSPVARLVRWFTAFLSSFLFFGIYSILFWLLIDRTPGKALLGLRVVRPDGDKLTFWRAVRRAVGYILSALPLFLGYLWVLVDDRRRGWHDKLADTVVVYDWDARLGRRVREWLTRQFASPAETVEPDPAELPAAGNNLR